MVRSSVVALLGCVYVAGSMWLVRNEGRAYREALGRARLTDGPVAVSAPDQPAQPEKVAVPKSGAAPEPVPRAEVADLKAQPLPPPVPIDIPRPVSPAPPGPATAQPPGNVPKGAPRLDLDPFWKQPYLTKVWDLDRLTAQDEISLGNELHNLILQLNPHESGSGRQRVVEAARPILELRSRKDLEYDCTILNSDVPNAFSHPGGFIYLSRKLLDMIGDDEDYLLEFVIGHEVAHIELQHALQCLRDPGVRRFKDGTLQKLYFLIIPHAYPKELEFAADAWVYQRMKRLGRSDHDCLAFLRKLAGYAQANGFADGQGKLEDLFKEGRGNPDGVSAISPIENHLRAHSAAWERLDHLKQLRDQAAKAPK